MAKVGTPKKSFYFTHLFFNIILALSKVARAVFFDFEDLTPILNVTEAKAN